MQRARISGAIDRIRGPFKGKIVIFEAFILVSILILGFMIRIMPIRWGVYLMEFDPWMQFKEMNYVIEGGWKGFIDFFNWHDYTSWYPHGRDVGRTAFPGLPFMAAFLYHLLHGIGLEVDALELAAIFPVFMALIAILFAYLLGREVGGKPAGLVAAFFMAISRAHVERSLFGWFDDESIGIPLLMIGLWAYLNALKEERSRFGVVAYSLLSGLSLGYLAASWGAAKFPLAFIPLVSVILALIGRYNRQLLVSFTITFSTYTMVAVMVPKLGPGFLREITILSGFAALVILIAFEVSKLYPGKVHIRRLPYYVIAAGAAGYLGMMAAGYMNVPGIKFLSVLAPQMRYELPIVISVQENQLSTWAVMFSDMGFMVLFSLMGLYYAFRRRSNSDIILALFTIFAIYFSSTMVRLSTLAAPGVAVMAGLGLTEVLGGFVRAMKIASAKTKIKPIGIEYYVLTPMLVIGLLVLGIVPTTYGVRYSLSAIDISYTPPTIVSAATPFRMAIPTWLKTLEWMRTNLPEDAVVACWWDYGYWVTVLGNRTSIADNATLNSTHIGEIGYAFMSNETIAYRTFKKLGATHVLIFVTHYAYGQQASLLGYGDEGKWIWMLRIANQEGHAFKEEDYLTEQGSPTDKFWSGTTLGQLIPYKPVQTSSGTLYVYQPSQLQHFRLVYESDEPYTSIAYVYIYELVD
ncbi:MAG: hypothetical protein N3F65_01990 [Nitrososphaeria archaeon]|nr:hypothetical protein [Nitrososphaeria archaeon]